jgi:hypothetical protein
MGRGCGASTRPSWLAHRRDHLAFVWIDNVVNPNVAATCEVG